VFGLDGGGPAVSDHVGARAHTLTVTRAVRRNATTR
jgi:hypothetical protein